MAGRGFPPRDSAGMRVVPADPVKQPPLPKWHKWHAGTKAWWKMWADFPLSADFTEADWVFLIETAVLVDALYCGDLKHAAEVRLRVAKYGVTPEDRARLRVTFATAAKAEGDKPKPSPRSDVRVVK